MATRKTAQSYLHASIYFDAYNQFGELSPEHAKLAKYSKFKTVQIINCLNRGEVPPAGDGSGMDEDEAELMQFTASSPEPNSQSSYPSVPSTPSTGPVVPSAPAFQNNVPNIPTVSAGGPVFATQPSSSTPSPVRQPSPPQPAPSHPVFHQPSPSQQQASPYPAPTDTPSPSNTPPVAYPSPAPVVAPSPSPPLPTYHQPAHPVQSSQPTQPTQPPPSYSHASQVMVSSSSQMLQVQSSQSYETSPDGYLSRDPDVIMKATNQVRHFSWPPFSLQAKYILSALQFEDTATAVRHLKICLQMLTGKDY